jgi:hypothetical protein
MFKCKKQMTKSRLNLRNVAAIAACLAVVVLFAGCSQLSAPVIYSPEAMNELTADLKKIAETYKIEQVQIFEKDKLSNDLGMVIVTMRDSEGKHFEQNLRYNSGIPHDDPKPVRETSWNGKKPDKTHIEIDEIIAQKDNIEKYVEEAKVQIAEGLENKYNFESVGTIIFKYDKRGDMRIEFTVNVTEQGKSQRREGGRQVTDYYGLDFYVDENGNVVYVE